MASSIPRRRPPTALALAAVVMIGTVLRAGQAPPAPPGSPQQTTAASAQAPAPAAPANELFETRIRPLLAANCYACHGESAMGGLRVDSREGMLRGGASGPALVPGDPEKSTLLKVRAARDGFPRMPRGRAKLPAADIDALSRVDSRRARRGPPRPPRQPPAPAAAHERVITPGAARVLVVPADCASPPRRRCQHSAWPKTDIDRFVLARLEQRRPRAGARRRQAHADPPRHARSDRPAADARGDRRVREGRRRPTRSPRSSIGCSPRRATARRGAASGSTSRATAKTTTAASIRWAAATTRIRTRICIATG